MTTRCRRSWTVGTTSEPTSSESACFACQSPRRTDGVEYAFHYGPKGADEPHVRYDNHHGTHERHEGDRIEEVEFPGYEALLERFEREIPFAIDP